MHNYSVVEVGSELKDIQGKVIRRLLINDDQSILVFRTDTEDVSYVVFGDCCSESWFADITGVEALLDGVVRSATVIDMPNYNVDDGRTRQEVDEAYGINIQTNKGYASIVFRNSSNGYYGGNLASYQGKNRGELTEITADWQA